MRIKEGRTADKDSEPYLPKNRIHGILEEIRDTQLIFQDAGSRDGDGAGDYGSLEDLIAISNRLNPALESGPLLGYTFTVEVTAGSDGTPPSFTARATSSVPGFPAYWIDESARRVMPQEY